MRFDNRSRVSTYLSDWMPSGDTMRQGVAGYVAGGYDTAYLSAIDKITFPADTKTTLSATLTSVINGAYGFADSGVAGYNAGGYDSSVVVSGIDKIAFPADTKTTLSATVSTASYSGASFADSGVAGYFGGGSNAGAIEYSFIDKLAFPAETRTTMTTTLTSTRRQLSGFGNNGVAGYFCGGNDDTGGGNDVRQDNIQKISFTSDSSSTLAATLTVRLYHGTFADNGVAGYICGGNANASNGSGGNFASIDKIALPADTKTVLSATLSTARYLSAGMSNSGTAGYAAGGYDSGNISGIDKIAFPADTKTTLSATLTSARYGGQGFSNQGVF